MSPKTLIKEARKTGSGIGGKKSSDQAVQFELYAPDASKVLLVGEFNDWSTNKNPMKKDASGKWRLSLKLKPGRYQYRYWVDGNWENDQQAAEYVPNTYGTWNCLIEVKA